MNVYYPLWCNIRPNPKDHLHVQLKVLRQFILNVALKVIIIKSITPDIEVSLEKPAMKFDIH